MAKENTKNDYVAPDVSRDLIPVALDRLAKEDPEAVFVTIASEDGNRRITFGQYANATNGVARGSNDCLAYLGTGGGDLFYPILLIAAVKAGYYMLFNSPRNSVDAHVNLFDLQKCRTLIVPQPQPPYIAPFLAAYDVRTLTMPPLDEFMDTRVPDDEYKKSFEEARKLPLVALHTSGSTGLPKPIVWNHECAAIAVNAYQAPMPDGTAPVSQLYRDDILFSAMPMFHAAGLTINVLGPVFSGHKLVLPAPGPLLNADGAISLIQSTRATAAILPPSTLEEISKRPELLKTLTAMNYILAAGGGVSKAAGEVITSRTKLLNILGTTEFSAFSQIEVDQEDWSYMHFSPLTGVNFRPYSEDEHEMVVVRDEKLQRYQSCFELFPDLKELSSHDLFTRHPTKPDLWRYCGRSDDVIVFLTGEKTNPVSMEGLISNRPELSSALVLGQGRFEAGLLIEPAQPTPLSMTERAALIEKLWPTIQKANSQCPRHARVMKSRILFTNPEKPMARAGKGTVQRKATVANYAVEIDALYSDVDDIRNTKDLETVIKFDGNNIERWLFEIVRSAMGTAQLTAEDDFFSRGMDSLQVIQTVRLLKLGLDDTGAIAQALGPSTVYTHPTVAKLRSAIEVLMHDSRKTNEEDEEARANRMRSMLEKYSPTSSEKKASTVKRKTNPKVLMITGTTGNLGSYLLEAFAANESVSKIFCLNRSDKSDQQQARASDSRGLRAEWESQRVTFLTGDPSKKDLGLDHEAFTEISNTVDLIVHNAWRVDFNLSLASYEQGHIQGVRNLIDLSINTAGRIGIFFISSVGAVMNWPANHAGSVPEEVISDFTVPAAMGYAESKHISEQLLDLASINCNIPVSICRVGQIAGSMLGSKGMWNKREWFPSLITSSRHLGIIPDSLGNLSTIDWIPIDVLSMAITELALQPFGEGSRVYHAINPSLATWATLLPYVHAEMGTNVNIVTMATWLNRLRASDATSVTSAGHEINPALKLMGFYEGLLSSGSTPARLETRKTCDVSPTLSALGPVRGDSMVKWMRQWVES